MARAPLLQISDVALSLGGRTLFSDLSLTLGEGDRLALVGRNGSGKSSLMKLMAGLIAPDAGKVAGNPGLEIGYLEQDPDYAGHATLGDWAAAGLAPGEDWRIERAAAGLGFAPQTPVATASGGERRRAALARLLAREPALLLLDEPTNHLDIAAILWLEAALSSHSGAFIAISHDRAFLRGLTRGTLWIDRGEVRRQDRGIEAFEDWRDRVWAEEDLARHKLDRLIKAEAKWAVEGISARRKRNQGRVRALAGLREERAAMIRRQGTAEMALDTGPQSGRRVIEATAISQAFGDNVICRNLDLRLMRGDRLAIAGPNGVGKTTLIELLTGARAPDAGQVTLGTNLDVALFDQRRAALDDDATLWESLTGDAGIGVSGRSDQVMVRGAARHVVGYLKEFLFDESQARASVGSLSGGERARLLLARLMARQSNLLVLDEPTNDLDVETLDLLVELLADYDGTAIIVSHDRDFIDRVATMSLHMTGGGKAALYAGGWSDMLAQGAIVAPEDKPASASRAPRQQDARPKAKAKSGLSFTQAHRLKVLPAEIDRMTGEVASLSTVLADPGLFASAPEKFAKTTDVLATVQAKLDAAEAEWLELAMRAEEGDG